VSAGSTFAEMSDRLPEYFSFKVLEQGMHTRSPATNPADDLAARIVGVFASGIDRILAEPVSRARRRQRTRLMGG
jgi:hypothetical protein